MVSTKDLIKEIYIFHLGASTYLVCWHSEKEIFQFANGVGELITS